MTPVDRLLVNLPDAKKNGKGWSARCPAHDDRRASLSITEVEDGRVLVHCHKGCEPAAVAAALGLTLADLMPEAPCTSTRPPRSRANQRFDRQDNGQPAGKTYATACDAVSELERRHGPCSAQWTYHDAKGQPVGFVLRWDLPDGKKDIRPVSRHADGWHIAGMPSPRPLYGLPDLASASRVYVCEGEKAADAARSIGLVATTSAHGAESADKTDWSPLAGKEVILLPDNDTSGRKYDDAVARILATLTPPAVAKLVELLNLPAGGDIVDWIEAHGDAAEPDELRRQIEALVAQADVLCSPRPRETTAAERDPWPDPLEPEGFHGLAGEIVRIIEPHSESDVMALLAQLLTGFGNLIGRSAHFRAEGDVHPGKLFCSLVGTTSKGRKGSSWSQIRRLLAEVDPDWASNRAMSGLSSGEGLIWAVRDPIFKCEPIREKKQVIGYQDVKVDPGIADKRLLVIESELGGVLRVLKRESNTLSAVVRDAWDKSDLRSMTKNSPAVATGCHISILGHITRDELRRHLTETDMANGFANRFLWFCVRRSKCLPEGGNLSEDEFAQAADRVRTAVEFARSCGELRRDDEAREIWRDVYPDLSAGRSGLLGAVTSRAEAQTMRLAMIYALLDCSPVIEAEHLRAALAVWKYAEESARYIFGSALGDPTADEILRALRAAGHKGMTRTEIREHFGRHKSSDEIGRALGVLEEAGHARRDTRDTDGRPAEVWFAT